MGLFDFWRRRGKALRGTPEFVEALADRRVSPYPLIASPPTQAAVANAYERGLDASYGVIFETQPAVRSVCDFIARNTAQLGLKLYERLGDNDRERREDHPAAELMADPDGQTPADAFIYRLVLDYLIWDNAYALKLRPPNANRLYMVRIPPPMVTVYGAKFRKDGYVLHREDGTEQAVPPGDVLHWFGYHPSDPLLGLSKLETLRQELASDAATRAAMVELAKSGLKGGYIARPLEAPVWSPEDAQRFAERWREAKTRGDGSDPVLEEGMRFEQAGISPKDAEAIASRQFTKAEVAAIYGVPLEVLGAGGNSDEQRRLVYADVLPPITQRLAKQLTLDLLRAEYSEPDYYFEFDLNSKLAGQPETRFAALTAAAGRPWRTVNETRALENMSPIEGGDALTIPLNVMLAGEDSPALPAPNVMPPQDPNDVPQDGSHREASLKQLTNGSEPRRIADFRRQKRYIAAATDMMRRYYGRQEQALRDAKAYPAETKAANDDRWNRELAEAIKAFVSDTIDREGNIYVARLGGAEFDMGKVENYVLAMADGAAERLNAVTQAEIAAYGLDAAFERIENERVPAAGISLGARATVFARTEAAKQAPEPHRRVKMWIANTERHAALDGAGVPLSGDWGGIEPGSEPHCACSVEIV